MTETPRTPTPAIMVDADRYIAERKTNGDDRDDEIIRGVYCAIPPHTLRHNLHRTDIADALTAQQLPATTKPIIGTRGEHITADVAVFTDTPRDDTSTHHPIDIALAIEIITPWKHDRYWAMKIERYESWAIAVAIYDEHGTFTNRHDLPDDIQHITAHLPDNTTTPMDQPEDLEPEVIQWVLDIVATASTKARDTHTTHPEYEWASRRDMAIEMAYRAGATREQITEARGDTH